MTLSGWNQQLRIAARARRRRARAAIAVALAIAALLIEVGGSVAQSTDGYSRVDDWAQLPPGREWGAVTGVFPDPDGDHIWVIDRCGANDCIGSDLDPIFKFDLTGKLIASFGAGVFAWPHSLFVDHEGFLWVTEAGTGARATDAARVGKGHQVIKLSPDGRVVMALGTAGAAGNGENTFNGPSGVLVAPNGDIFVVDGHGRGGNNRVVKFSPDGRFLKTWGTTGPGPAAGEMRDPHDLAMVSRGRLFVADRLNSRIQIFDQEGTFLEAWTQFGPASGLFIDDQDRLYATDTETGVLPPEYAVNRDSSWVRGIRIGDARSGSVSAFIPSVAEFVAADRFGNVYAAEIMSENLVKYIRVDDSQTGR